MIAKYLNNKCHGSFKTIIDVLDYIDNYRRVRRGCTTIRYKVMQRSVSMSNFNKNKYSAPNNCVILK